MSPSRLSTAAVLTGLLSLATTASAADSCPSNTLKTSYAAPVAANGWSYRLVANGFTKPRSIAIDKHGGLLVVDSGVGLAHLTLKDNGGTCLSVTKKTMLVKNEELNHGLALSHDGSTVYASSSDEVYSWSYNSKAISVGSSNHTLVKNMSTTDHTTRTLLVSNKHPNTLLVSRGSESDSDSEARQLNSGHSQIRSFDIKSHTYDFLDGTVLGWGLRNSVGVGEHPTTGGIWSVENSVDVLTRDGTDIHQNNPGEELNFHGFLNGSTDHQGGNYGYPLCYSVWSTKDFPKLGSLETGDQFPGNSASTLTDSDCNTKYVDPRLAFQAHSAPLDIKFTDDGSMAYITFHGSWDRTNPTGYRIISVAFDTTTGQPVEKQDSMDAAVDVLTNPNLDNCPGSCFRPVGLAWDSKGRLWFSSDSTGEIFVMEHSSSGGKGGGGGGGGGGKDDGDSAGAQLVSSGKAAWAVTLAAVVVGYFLA